MPPKTKIVLDSDVLIHFIKADRVTLLLEIFSEYKYIILDVVYDELKKHRDTRIVIDNICTFMANRITTEKFAPRGLMLRGLEERCFQRVHIKEFVSKLTPIGTRMTYRLSICSLEGEVRAIICSIGMPDSFIFLATKM